MQVKTATQQVDYSDANKFEIINNANNSHTFAISEMLTASKTYDPASLAAGAGTSTTLTVTGAALGDPVIASLSVSQVAGQIIKDAFVSAANTVTVTLENVHNTTTLDLASCTLRAIVFKVAT